MELAATPSTPRMGPACITVKQLAYSSITAFLAHYRALTQASADRGRPDALSADERERLAAMRSLMGSLTSEEQAVLNVDPAGAAPNRASREQLRHFQRAETKLRRLLSEGGVLSG